MGWVNSFGTSVGSRALTMRQAIIIAAVCEILGAASLGSAVSNKLVKQISNLQGAHCWNCNVGVDNHHQSQDMFWGEAPSNCSQPSHRDSRNSYSQGLSGGGMYAHRDAVCDGGG